MADTIDDDETVAARAASAQSPLAQVGRWVPAADLRRAGVALVNVKIRVQVAPAHGGRRTERRRAGGTS